MEEKKKFKVIDGGSKRQYGPVEFYAGKDFGADTDKLGFDHFDYYLNDEELAKAVSDYFPVHYGSFEMNPSGIVEMVLEFRMNNKLFDNKLFVERCRELFMEKAKEAFEEYLADEEEYNRSEEEYEREHATEFNLGEGEDDENEIGYGVEDSCVKDTQNIILSTEIELDELYDYVMDNEDYYKKEMPEEYSLVVDDKLPGNKSVLVGVEAEPGDEISDGEVYIIEVDIPDEWLPIKKIIEQYIADNEDKLCQNAIDSYDPEAAEEEHAEDLYNIQHGK